MRSIPRFRRRWWLALVASVALHALVLALIRPDIADVRPSYPAPIDPRVEAPTTITLVDEVPETPVPIRIDPQPPRTKPAPLPPSIARPDPTPLPETPPASQSPIRAVSATSTPSQEGGNGSANGSPVASNFPRGGDLPNIGRALHKPIPAGSKVVYLLDRSGSMSRGDRLRLAVTCIRRSLRELGPETRFAVVVYHSHAECLPTGTPPDLMRGTPENVRKVEAALEELLPEGGSAHMAGMRKAFALEPDAVLLLTDADDLPGEMVEAALTLRGRTRIFPVIFGSEYGPDATSSLKALAAGSRGVVGAIPLPPTTERISADQRVDPPTNTPPR